MSNDITVNGEPLDLDATRRECLKGTEAMERLGLENLIGRYSEEHLIRAVNGSSHVIVALIDRVRRMVARNEYKRRQAPPIIRVRARAFGTGRQMPIAAKTV